MHRREFLERSMVAGAALLSGCSSEHPLYQGSPKSPQAIDRSADVQQIFGGADSIAILHKFDKVEAFRLQDSEGAESIDQFKTVAGPIVLDQGTARRLGKLLADENSYQWDIGKSCIPNYGVRIRFTRGEVALDVLFCFECDLLGAYWNEKPQGQEDFDPIRPQLVAIMKSLFPKDEEIQKLQKKNAQVP